ncbi:MAG: phage coat protein, partial [Firmicutes bacterium]|nr:phage coat protein [Bacillota bacterium]
MAKFDSKTFNPQAFGKYISTVPQLKKNELLHAGVLRASSEIKNAFSSQSGSAYAVLPMYGLLGGAAQNYDGISDFIPAVTNTFERGVVVVGRMRAWTEKDFSDDVAGAGFMDNVAAQISEYFDGVDQSTMLAILEGVFKMTGSENTNFVNEHTLDITEEGNGCVGATTLNDAVLKACGDNKGRFSVVIMHSKVATNLENLNLIDYTSNT